MPHSDPEKDPVLEEISPPPNNKKISQMEATLPS
jgi:hypothetical protein